MMRKFLSFLFYIGMAVMLTAGSIHAVRLNDKAPYAPLNSGCITTSNQTIAMNTAPAIINATAASGGTCGIYSYQWQLSVDSVQFYNIAGATGQNLSYTGTLAQTTWFQRKVTCGAEVTYTRFVRVTPQ